jgi:hypothetical protein
MNKINFHQTFPPTLNHISGLLYISDMTEELTKEEISELTGIPTGKSSGKVEPHIQYAIYMGLLENISSQRGKYMLKLTKLGEIVKYEDPGLREEVTQLLCHCRITSPSTGAFLWRHIIRDILPRYSEDISYFLLEDELKRHIESNINYGPFYSSYENSFDTFNLVERAKDCLKIIPQGYKDELLYVYAYNLLYEWEQQFPEYDEITADQLALLKTGSAFGMSKSEEYYVFEKLSENRIIRINAQLSPYTIIRNTSSEAVLDKVYSLLL